MEHCLTGFLLSDVLNVGEHVIGKESHPKRMDLWQVTSCRDKNRVLAGSSKMHQKRVTFGRVQEFWRSASRTHRKRMFYEAVEQRAIEHPAVVRKQGTRLMSEPSFYLLTHELSIETNPTMVSRTLG
jgi:hypothetical protein